MLQAGLELEALEVACATERQVLDPVRHPQDLGGFHQDVVVGEVQGVDPDGGGAGETVSSDRRIRRTSAATRSMECGP